MNLTLTLTHEPETVARPEMHYVFVERTGRIPDNAPQAWHTVQPMAAEIAKHNQITGAMALYRCGPDVYRAGFTLASLPVNLPEGLAYEKLSAGKYTRFTLTGPYDQLPQATTRAFEIIAEKNIPVRDGFNIERYLTDPSTTPPENAVTEILFPAA